MLDLAVSTWDWLASNIDNWTMGHRGGHCPGFNLNLLKLPSTYGDMARQKAVEGR